MAKAKPGPRRPDPRRILIVDDHPMMRRGLAALIDGEPDLVVCGEAENGKEALDAVGRTKPHLVVVDLSLKEGDGLDLIKDLHKRHPEIPTLVLSAQDEALHAERVFRAGARGYVAKHEMGETVLNAIHRLLAGGRHMSERLASRFAEAFLGGRVGEDAGPLASLTDREFQVFRLIGEGKPTRVIAQVLRLSVKTVDSHRENLKAKLGAESSAALVLYATRWVNTGEVSS